MTDSTTIRVSVFIAPSVDGFIARPDGDVAYLSEFEPIAGGGDGGYTAFFNTIDVLVMGRGSFEKVLTFDWPYQDKPVVVLSKTLTEVPEALRGSVRIESGSPQAVLTTLTQEGYRHAYLDGGKVIQSFLREGLVDEMTLTIMPILLGEGVPLFGGLGHDIALRLLENRVWPNGFVQSKYQVVK